MSINQLKQLSVRDASLNLRVESINATSATIPTMNVNNFNASNVFISNNEIVGGDVSISGNTVIAGRTDINGDILAFSNLTVNKNIVVGSNVSVAGDLYSIHSQTRFPEIKGSDYELLNQATSITTPVTTGTGKAYTLINTQNAILAAGAATKFVFTNALIDPAKSLITASVVQFGNQVYGTGGLPVVYVDTLTVGGCEVYVANAGTVAMNEYMRILVTVINRVS